MRSGSLPTEHAPACGPAVENPAAWGSVVGGARRRRSDGGRPPTHAKRRRRRSSRSIDRRGSRPQRAGSPRPCPTALWPLRRADPGGQAVHRGLLWRPLPARRARPARRGRVRQAPRDWPSSRERPGDRARSRVGEVSLREPSGLGRPTPPRREWVSSASATRRCSAVAQVILRVCSACWARSSWRLFAWSGIIVGPPPCRSRTRRRQWRRRLRGR